MPPFMCLLVGQSDEVVNCEAVEAENMAHAMNKSESMLRSRAGLSSVEIWQEGRLALKMTRIDLLSGQSPITRGTEPTIQMRTGYPNKRLNSASGAQHGTGPV
jgi:hypothetical protein